VHFPTIDSVDDNYFAQLTAEHVVVRRREGRSYRQWILPLHKRNETLDCYVPAMAACRATGFRLDGEIVAQTAPPPLGDLPVSVDGEPPPEPWIDRNRLRPRSAWWDRKNALRAWKPLRKQQVSETPPLPLPRRDPPVQETRWIWFWDDKKKVMDGYWTDGPPLEPPGFRPKSYHSHHELPPDWLFPRGRRYSWWDGRAR
jgi:hypothetical protein